MDYQSNIAHCFQVFFPKVFHIVLVAQYILDGSVERPWVDILGRKIELAQEVLILVLHTPSDEEAGVAVAVQIMATLRTVGCMRESATQYTYRICHALDA